MSTFRVVPLVPNYAYYPKNDVLDLNEEGQLSSMNDRILLKHLMKDSGWGSKEKVMSGQSAYYHR